MPQPPARKDATREIPFVTPPEPIVSQQSRPPRGGPIPQPVTIPTPPQAKSPSLPPVKIPTPPQARAVQLSPSSNQHPALVAGEPEPLTVEQLVKEVGGRYDTLNKLWTQAEDSLKKFLVPHRVEHCFDSYVDNENPDHERYRICTCHCLTWAKSGNSWRLCYEIYTADEPDRSYAKPITECSADIRQNLVGHFPALREKVIKAARENVSKLDKAIADFASVLK